MQLYGIQKVTCKIKKWKNITNSDFAISNNDLSAFQTETTLVATFLVSILVTF